MDKKYTVFINSTFKDLAEERKSLIMATLEIGHIPVGMEMFNAADESQWEIIKRTIDDCDYYVVIIGHRYGSIDSSDHVSYTEKEYDYAVSKGIPVLAFVIDDEALRPSTGSDRESDPLLIQKLNVFKEKALKRMANFWIDQNDLARAFLASLFKAERTYPRPGWIRHNFDDREKLLGRINELTSKIEFLELGITSRQEASSPLIPNISEIVKMIRFKSWRVGTIYDQFEEFREHIEVIEMQELFNKSYKLARADIFKINRHDLIKVIHSIAKSEDKIKNESYEILSDSHLEDMCDDFVDSCETLELFEVTDVDRSNFIFTELAKEVYKQLVIKRMTL